MKTRTAHYVLSTHWDREWYQHFQDYRYRLVRLIDRILTGWKDGSLAGPFQTDGQAVILEDYLEIRPERRNEIEQRAREGSLVVGPWYVLPDEFLVSGEALVRNLQLGRQLARDLGAKPSDAGFLCDMFGHNSQMPQIFAGFGIRGAFVWRGINLVEQRLFRWQAADGSEVLTYRFGWGGYCDYSRSVRASHRKNQPFDLEDSRSDFETFLDLEAGRTQSQTVLLFDGGDHMEWDREAYQVVLEQMDRADQNYAIVHTDLDQYLAQLLEESLPEGPVVKGELRDPAQPPDTTDRQWLIAGVLSSRVWIKQRNANCQALLCLWAEPFSALANLALGCEIPQGFLNTAWKWLLQNHPHDSICGCSIDAVHEDMKYRFTQTQTIARRLINEALRAISSAVSGTIAENEVRVTVYNPSILPLDQIVDLTLEIPAEWPTFGEMGDFELKPAFRIFDAAGCEINYQRLSQVPNQKRYRMYDSGFPKGYRVTETRVALRLQIPAVGYTTLSVRSGEQNIPTRFALFGTLTASCSTLENEYLVVKVEPNGTLAVRDKHTGEFYTGWLTLEDSADIGDGWNYGQAVNNQVFSNTAASASVALVENGPLKATLRIRSVLELPAAFDFDRMTRSDLFERLVVDTWVTLRAGQKYLDCESVVHNGLRDHRLRMMFPSGAQATTYLADSPFDVIERPVSLRPDNHLYREMELETKPQQTWTAVFDERRGLVAISTGLLETAVQDTPERSLALTLFRSTSRTVFTNGEPEGQLQGDLHFRYWVMPLSGEPDRAELCRLGQLLEAGLTAAQISPADQFIYGTGTLPPQGGLLMVNGPVVVTSIQMKAENLEVRLFNPNTTSVNAILRPAVWNGCLWSCARLVNLEGITVGQPIRVAEGEVRLEVLAKKIMTLQFCR